MAENTFNNQPDPPALSPDKGERFSERDVDREELRRSAMLHSGPKKEYTAEEFHRELAARLVEQARREQEARDRVQQEELILRFDDLAGRVDRSNNLKREIGSKVDKVEGKVDTIIIQNAAARKAFGIDLMTEDDKSAAPAVLRSWQDRQRRRGSGLLHWQKVGIVAAVIFGGIAALASIYSALAGVLHPVLH